MQPQSKSGLPALIAALRARYLVNPALFVTGGLCLLAVTGAAGWYGVKGLGSGSRPVPAPPPSALNDGAADQTPISSGSDSKKGGSDTPKPSSQTNSPAGANKAAGSGPAQTNGSGGSSGSSVPSGGGSAPVAAPTFGSETSYAAPAFAAVRTINVTTQSAFMTAWNAIQPGDLINVAGVTFTGEVTLANKQLSDYAEIHFDAATRFVGVSSAQNLPAVWINNDSHIRFYGADISDSAAGGQAGDGILVYDSDHVSWWDFVIHNTGRNGLSVYSVNKTNDSLDFKGEISNWGLNTAWDPHAEKGTGLHGANLADSNYGVQNSRFALYLHDGPSGAGIQAGGASSTDLFKNNTIYAWCQNLTKVALSQTGGNCLQFWGENVTGNAVKYLEAENLQGRPFETGGMYSGQSLSSNTIEYGRASNTNLNKKINDSIPQNVLWDYQFGTVFVDVSPLP